MHNSPIKPHVQHIVLTTRMFRVLLVSQYRNMTYIQRASLIVVIFGFDTVLDHIAHPAHDDI